MEIGGGPAWCGVFWLERRERNKSPNREAANDVGENHHKMTYVSTLFPYIAEAMSNPSFKKSGGQGWTLGR